MKSSCICGYRTVAWWLLLLALRNPRTRSVITTLSKQLLSPYFFQFHPLSPSSTSLSFLYPISLTIIAKFGPKSSFEKPSPIASLPLQCVIFDFTCSCPTLQPWLRSTATADSQEDIGCGKLELTGNTVLLRIESPHRPLLPYPTVTTGDPHLSLNQSTVSYLSRTPAEPPPHLKTSPLQCHFLLPTKPSLML